MSWTDSMLPAYKIYVKRSYFLRTARGFRAISLVFGPYRLPSLSCILSPSFWSVGHVYWSLGHLACLWSLGYIACLWFLCHILAFDRWAISLILSLVSGASSRNQFMTKAKGWNTNIGLKLPFLWAIGGKGQTTQQICEHWLDEDMWLWR